MAAIDFPASPSVNQTHTASGVTWTWDGTSWKAQGSTTTYNLPTASTGTLGGIKVGNNFAIDGSGSLSLSPVAISGLTNVTAGKVLQVVQGNVVDNEKAFTTTSFAASDLSATITPTAASSKILIHTTQVLDTASNGRQL